MPVIVLPLCHQLAILTDDTTRMNDCPIKRTWHLAIQQGEAPCNRNHRASGYRCHWEATRISRGCVLLRLQRLLGSRRRPSQLGPAARTDVSKFADAVVMPKPFKSAGPGLLGVGLPFKFFQVQSRGRLPHSSTLQVGGNTVASLKSGPLC